jgi:flagellar biosynthesis/type III secretory pathway chaperone
MEPQACRAQFARLLSDEATLLSQLEQQLQREHQYLATNDVEGLEQAGGARQQTIAKLLRLDDERNDLSRLLGHGPGRAGLAALLTWCDSRGTLAAALASCTQLAERCRTQNERNGALVTARLGRVSGMLDMLSDHKGSQTYDPRLARTATTPAGRLVSISA